MRFDEATRQAPVVHKGLEFSLDQDEPILYRDQRRRDGLWVIPVHELTGNTAKAITAANFDDFESAATKGTADQ